MIWLRYTGKLYIWKADWNHLLRFSYSFLSIDNIVDEERHDADESATWFYVQLMLLARSKLNKSNNKALERLLGCI